MSQNLHDQPVHNLAAGIKPRTKDLGSDNVCSVTQSESDSECNSDSLSGKVHCRACHASFVPDKTRRAFCDHACYADWRSKRTSVVDRFWSKVNKTSTCWLWTGATRGGGYGFIAQRRVDGKQVRTMAHRVSWELAFGKVLDGLSVRHRCDTPACVNPAHLFLGTQQDNILDALHKGRLIGRDGRQLHATEQSLHPQRQQEPRSLSGSGVPDQSLADVHRSHTSQSVESDSSTVMVFSGNRQGAV